jgi:putative oxidoreductase
MKSKVTYFSALVARLLIAQVFLFAAFNKLSNPAKTAGLIASKGIPFPLFCCFVAAGIELIGSLALVAGFKIRWTAIVLAIFVLVVTSIFHWDFTKDVNVHYFRKDIAIAGGLLLAACYDAAFRVSNR